MKYLVGLSDSQGNICYLAGYKSDPTRYYSRSCALEYKTIGGAKRAIVRAKKTHPGKSRSYIIIQDHESC